MSSSSRGAPRALMKRLSDSHGCEAQSAITIERAPGLLGTWVLLNIACGRLDFAVKHWGIATA
jgi:hypothetical protein